MEFYQNANYCSLSRLNGYGLSPKMLKVNNMFAVTFKANA